MSSLTVRLRGDELAAVPDLLGDVGAGLIDGDLEVQRSAGGDGHVASADLTGRVVRAGRNAPVLVGRVAATLLFRQYFDSFLLWVRRNSRGLLVGSPVDEGLDERKLQDVLAGGVGLGANPEGELLVNGAASLVAAGDLGRRHGVGGLGDDGTAAGGAGVEHVAELVVVDP